MARTRKNSQSGFSRSGLSRSSSAFTTNDPNKKDVFGTNAITTHISSVRITNDTNENIEVKMQSTTRLLQTMLVAPGSDFFYHIANGMLSEEELITITVTPFLGEEEYYLYFHYSTFSDAYAQVNAKNIFNLNVNLSRIIPNPECDHFSNHVKRLELHSVAGVGYVARFRVYYKKPGCAEDYSTSKTFNLGKSKYWDCIDELNLPDNTEVRAAVCSILNLITKKVYRVKIHSDVWYVRHDSSAIRKYKCKGTVGSPKIERY